MKIVPKALETTDDASRGKATKRTIATDCLAVCLTFLLVYVVLGWIGEVLAGSIPDRWEREMAGFAELMADPADADALARAQRVLDHLTTGEALRDLDYTLFYLDQSLPNAIAVPGGGIGVTRRLLDEVDSDVGLAMVLGHELGHHQHRHLLRRMGRHLVFAAALSLIGHTEAFGSVEQGLKLAESGYDRGQEREADRFAAALVARKYEDTSAALEFFEHIQETQREPLWQKYAGSHPLTQERLADLEGILAQDPRVQPAD